MINTYTTIPGANSRECHNGDHVPVATLTPVTIWFIMIMFKRAA